MKSEPCPCSGSFRSWRARIRSSPPQTFAAFLQKRRGLSSPLVLWRGISSSSVARNVIATAERALMNSHEDKDRDQLTGLPNLRAFEAALKRELQAQRQEGGNFVVLRIDMDWFRRINDSLGVSSGDSYLREVATQLQRNIQSTDSLTRTGANEFAVLLRQMTLETATRCAHRFVERTRESSVVPQDLRCTLSIGGVVCRASDAATPEALFRQAGALLGAKAPKLPDGSTVRIEYFRPDVV